MREGGYEENTDPMHEVIKSMGQKAVFQKTDASKEADVKALVDVAVKEFRRLDMYDTLTWG